MPDLPISQLPASGSLTGSEIYVFVQGGVTVQGTLNDISTFIGGAFIPLSGTTPGNEVTGTIKVGQSVATIFELLTIFGKLTQISFNTGFTAYTEDQSTGSYSEIVNSSNGFATITTSDGSSTGIIVYVPTGLSANMVFTPTAPEDFIQKGYADTAYAPKTKVSGSAIVTGGSITLPNTPTFVYSIYAGALPLQETDDYTLSGTTLTPTNPAVSNGDKIYYKYEY